jgi:hypothetical protein
MGGMGGMGSGNWWRWQGKKSTVEESLDLGLKDLCQRLFAGRGRFACLDMEERQQVEHRLLRHGQRGWVPSGTI